MAFFAVIKEKIPKIGFGDFDEICILIDNLRIEIPWIPEGTIT